MQIHFERQLYMHSEMQTTDQSCVAHRLKIVPRNQLPLASLGKRPVAPKSSPMDLGSMHMQYETLVSQGYGQALPLNR